MPDVICLGILVADVIARTVDCYPGRGELALVDEMHPSVGGCAANTGIGLQKLGVSTGVIGKVGRDGFGDFVRACLQQGGVDARGVSTDDRANTSATMAMVASDGERSFIHHTGANAAFLEEDIDWSLLDGCKLLHIAGHFLMPSFDGEPCARVLKKAREMGITTALDTAWDATGRWGETLHATLPYIDYFVPSLSEAQRCVPSDKADTPRDVAQYFLDQGVGVVALKMGEQGSYLRTPENEYSIAPFHVQAVDATGAGDAFAAGFLAGVMHGFDLPRCAELGNAVGACSVMQVGTVAGVRSLEETLRFIAEQKDAGRKE
jgi:sugar/nucleoside kinase (ribokinase family)